jgi:hypothetical protein
MTDLAERLAPDLHVFVGVDLRGQREPRMPETEWTSRAGTRSLFSRVTVISRTMFRCSIGRPVLVVNTSPVSLGAAQHMVGRLRGFPNPEHVASHLE